MRKHFSILLIVSFSFIMLVNMTATATSWEELKPQEVVDRAEVIVTGKYDFSSDPKSSEFVFQGLDFNIKAVYKGEVSDHITAGIDYNDVGWVKEFQKEGGEFLLFLERTEHADFLIPVGGPNGMVQVYEGYVKDPNEQRKAFFEEFIKSHPKETIDVAAVNNGQNDKTYFLLFISAIVLVGLATLLVIYRHKRSNNSGQ